MTKKSLSRTQFWWSDSGWRNWNWREVGIGIALVTVFLLCCAGLGMLYLHMVPVLINP